MSWVAAGVGSGAATMAGIQYLKGKRDQNKDEKNRPKYEIPDEVKQNLSLAKQQYLQGLPEEVQNQYMTNIQRNNAASLSAGSSRKGGLVGIGQINQNQNDAYGNLASMNAQARSNNLGQLYNQNQNMADYRDQAFQINQVNPYYEGIARREARTGALFQNLNNAGTMGMSGMGGNKSSTPNQSQSYQGNQMDSQYWNNKVNLQNYNQNTNNGFGDYQYQGQQYGNIG